MSKHDGITTTDTATENMTRLGNIDNSDLLMKMIVIIIIVVVVIMIIIIQIKS